MDFGKHTEYGGFARCEETGEEELLFVTEFSELLAKNRAAEAVYTRNVFGDKHFDPESVRAKQRTVFVIKHDWHDMDKAISSREDLDNIARLLYLDSLAIECGTAACAYNADGICRFALINDRAPRITEDDGCTEGVIRMPWND